MEHRGLQGVVCDVDLADFGEEALARNLEDLAWLMHVLDFVVSISAVTLMFALMYKILPRVKIAWRDVWVGAFVTSLLFTIGKFAVGLYIGKSKVASGFGAAGSVMIVLVWVYYSAQIFLLGAEFTWIYAHHSGSRQGEGRPQAIARPVDAPK